MSKISELSDGGSLLPTDFLIAVRSGGNVKVQADQTEFDRIRLGDNEKIELGNSQDISIYWDGSVGKITNSIDVTGNVALSGDITSTDTIDIAANGFGKGVNLKRGNGAVNGLSLSSGGDISFYEDTGTTAKLFWDASAESLGIGTGGPLGQLHINVETAVPTKVYVDGEANQPKSIEIRHYDTSEGSGAGRNLFYLKTPASGRLDIGNFSDGSSETQLMTFLESGNVGIGTSSPSQDLEILNGSTGAGIRLAATGTAYWDIERDATSGHLTFTDDGAGTVLTVGQDGNVGIGTSSPTADLEVSSASNPEISIASTVGSTSNFLNFKAISHTQQIQTQLKTIDNGDFTSDLAFLFKGTGTDGALSEKLRLNASGGLLVGTNISGIAGGTAQGINLLGQYGAIEASRSGNASLYLNRYTSDGKIAEFRKDGTTVGSIGTKVSSTYIGTGDTGLLFWNAQNAVTPYDTGDTVTNGTIDLGVPNYKFKDLYLSGGAYLGGTAAANKLSDFETGSWTPTFNSASFATGVTSTSGTYVKIGDFVQVSFNISFTGTSGNFAEGDTASIGGLPFNPINYNGGGTANASQAYMNNVRMTWQTLPIAASDDIFMVIHSGAGTVGRATGIQGIATYKV